MAVLGGFDHEIAQRAARRFRRIANHSRQHFGGRGREFEGFDRAQLQPRRQQQNAGDITKRKLISLSLFCHRATIGLR